MSPARRDLPVALATAAVFAALLQAGGGVWQHVNGGDLHGMFVPWFEHAAHTLAREGRVPLWTPTQFCGTPGLGLGQPSALYPPMLAAFAVLPPRAALQALYAFHVFVLAWGMVRWLAVDAVGRAAAAVGALLAVAGLFRGPLLAAIDHPTFLASLAWLPWMLLAVERLADTGAVCWAGAFAVVFALQWLGGYPDFGLVAPVVLGLVALVGGRVPLVRRMALLALGLGLGLLLAGAALVPMVEAIGESTRSAATLPPEAVRTFFRVVTLPALASALVGRFGHAGLTLAALALARPTRRRLAWAAALVWTVFALNVPFVWLYLLPPFDGVRYPFGWGGWMAVLVGGLAAAGLTVLWRVGRWGRPVAAAGAALVLVHAGGVIHGAPGALPAMAPRHPRFVPPDLAQAEMRARILAGLAQGGRILSDQEVAAASGLHFGLRLASGHEPSLPPRRVVQLLDLVGAYHALGLPFGWDGARFVGQPELAGALGVRLIVVPPQSVQLLEGAGFHRVATLPPNDVVLARPPRPRARLVHRVVEAEGEAGTKQALLDALPEGGAVAVVERGALPAPLAEPPAGALSERSAIVADEAERVVVRAEVAAPALLVLLDTWYPGWTATIDGVPAPILRADHAFRGVPLEPGVHEVVFTYAPASVRIGVAASAGGVLALGLLLVWDRRSRRILAAARRGHVPAGLAPGRSSQTMS